MASTEPSDVPEREPPSCSAAVTPLPHYLLDRIVDGEHSGDDGGHGGSSDGSDSSDGNDAGDSSDGSSSDGGSSDGGQDPRIERALIDRDSVKYVRKAIRANRCRDAEHIKELASRLTRLQQLPLRSLLRFHAPECGALFGPLPRDEPPWSKSLPAPPCLAAKEQEVTSLQRGALELEAKRCVALMKETRRLDNGERILAAKAPYDLDSVAAAIALLCGWFAKGNGAPNLTVAAWKLRSLGAGARSTKTTASVKAWMERLRQLDAAVRAQESEHYRIRKAQEQAEALEVLRRGIGPRTVVSREWYGSWCMVPG